MSEQPDIVERLSDEKLADLLKTYPRKDSRVHQIILELQRLRRAAPAAEVVEALEKIRTECDPGFLPFANPEEGRARIFKIADAALASTPAPVEAGEED